MLQTRTIPLLSVFAAFSFVIMMFNLPLPGGTTGHAVGMGVASIVLGPWASIVSISIALLIQAVFFGDGGITAIGANCFNMAIVGSLVAYGVYRLAARGARIGSARRVLAAGIGGYAGINAAALFAAVEFGIQPLLFHDASGAPLYAPYPLHISIPAMMIGHLTFAGLAEFVISGGIVAWLQRTDASLLRQTAPDAPDMDEPLPPRRHRVHWLATRKLWAGLALLMMATPLGILAVGSAWGEWGIHEFADQTARQQIAAVSGNQGLPEAPPSGMQRLSSIWTAPLPGYEPSFIRSASFGYFASAMVGVGLILAVCSLLGWLVVRRRNAAPGTEVEFEPSPGSPRRRGFVEKTMRGLLDAMQHALFAENMAASNGLLQQLDPRVKLVGLTALIIAAVAVHRIWVLIGIFGASLLLALFSRVPLRILATRVWLAVLAFTGVIALPAIFLTSGDALFHLPWLGWAVTRQGVSSAALLVLRAETAATLSMLLILCTLWTHLLRSLRFFRVPVVLVVTLGMTYRYVFLFLQTARDMFESREARLVGMLDAPERRRLATASAGVLLGKSLQLSGEVHLAMLARGFRGDVQLLDDLKIGSVDWLRLAAFVGAASAAIWLGR